MLGIKLAKNINELECVFFCAFNVLHNNIRGSAAIPVTTIEDFNILELS